MMVAFLIGALVFLFGGICIHAENRGEQSPIPVWLIVSTMVLLMGWMLYRALWARPRCPFCRCGDISRQADYAEELEGLKNSQNWRRYRCACCKEEFLVPGLSLDG